MLILLLNLCSDLNYVNTVVLQKPFFSFFFDNNITWWIKIKVKPSIKVFSFTKSWDPLGFLTVETGPLTFAVRLPYANARKSHVDTSKIRPHDITRPPCNVPALVFPKHTQRAHSLPIELSSCLFYCAKIRLIHFCICHWRWFIVICSKEMWNNS